jgi:nucleotide-binding universal stress UspA family protein
MNTPTILVATDFSQRSIDIVQRALPLAKELGGTLHVIHVIEESLFDFLEKDQPIIEHALEALKKHFPTINESNLHCKKGKVGAVIADLAKELSTKLIILGNSGEHGGLKNLFIGSSTKAIVRSVSVPVLVVKSFKDLDIKKLLIPTDFSKASKKHIQTMQSLFPKAKITLLHTYTVPFSTRLSLYGVKKGDVNLLGENLEIYAKNEAALFLEDFKNTNIDLIVREGALDPNFFTSIANMHAIQTISLHTTGSISLFAFDLLLETDKDVIINTI